jgi:hypothetical protein
MPRPALPTIPVSRISYLKFPSFIPVLFGKKFRFIRHQCIYKTQKLMTRKVKLKANLNVFTIRYKKLEMVLSNS